MASGSRRGRWPRYTTSFVTLHFQGPVAAQRSRLEASLRLQQFLRDVEEEEAWVKEREAVATSSNTGEPSPVPTCTHMYVHNVNCGRPMPIFRIPCHTRGAGQGMRRATGGGATSLQFPPGKDLTGVQSLQKKHQALTVSRSRLTSWGGAWGGGLGGGFIYCTADEFES